MKMLAIDIGASGGKAVLGTFEKNRISFREIYRFSNWIMYWADHKHWDFERLLDEVIKSIKTAGDVDSIGIDTWGVDYGCIDKDGNLLEQPFSYRDERTENIPQSLHRKITFEKLYSITGIQFMPLNTIYQLADDLSSHPELIEKTDRILMMPELFAHFLTGQSTSEYTNASTTGLLDARTRQWSDYILKAIGLPPDKLPPVTEPGTLKRKLRSDIADQTGCSADLITVATHDTASAIASIPAESDNWAYISSGTWSLVGIENHEPILTDNARKANFTNEGGVDGTYRFLTNVTGLWIIEELRKKWKFENLNVDYDHLLNEASKAPPSKCRIDPNHPDFTSPYDMREAIDNYCVENNQPKPTSQGEYVRYTLEGLARTYAEKIDAIKKITGREIEVIHVVGGGSQNSMLCQMTADTCNLPVIAGPVEATSMGNILVQMVANGLLGNIKSGRQLIAESIETQEFKPA